MQSGEGDVVSALRQGLIARIGSDRFELWFGLGVEWQVSNDCLIVQAGDEFTLERLRRQFGREIQTTLATVARNAMRVEYRVREPAQADATPDGVTDGGASGTVVPAAEELVAESVPTDSGRGTQRDTGGLRVVPPATGGGELTVRRRFARFESFVPGQGNKVALTAAQSVAARLGAISPLLVYGPSGCGKTHLLEAVWTASRAGRTLTRCLLLSAEQFTSFFLEALQGAGLPSFRRKVRDVDLLLIDDIQFFAGKRATLVEFQHTLDALGRSGRQLVVSSDRPPAELVNLGPELVARLAGGLVCGMELADYETRRGITRQWVSRDRLALSDDVVDLIALETNGDARQIRGALNRLQATSQALQQPITADLARSLLADLFVGAKRVVRLPDIERAVCETFGLEPKSLRTAGKSRSASQPRMLAMWLARKYTRLPFSEISEYFGRRSHSTVISAAQKVDRWVGDGARLQLGRSSWTIEEAIRRLETKLRTG